MTDAPCTLDNVTPRVITVPGTDSSERHVMFDLPDTPRLWAPAEPDRVIARFRSALVARVGANLDAQSLMTRQRKVFAAAPAEMRGETVNATLVLDGRVGRIAAINCLEAMLWKSQASRYDMLQHPTEFGAFVLRGHGRLHVYLSSADLVGQKIREPVIKQIEGDASHGYRVLAHLHNHPFLLDRKVGDRMWTLEATKDDIAGALAPSMTDVQFFRNMSHDIGLGEAWVTNGLHTSHFRAGEFEVLKSR